VPGSADRILRTLEGFGLDWDGPVTYQSRRIPLYEAAIERLRKDGRTFECSCSRRELNGAEDGGYPGTCRNGPTRPEAPTATRFRMTDGALVLFDDRVQGTQRFETRELGDFVIQRKDGIIAYQLAVSVDDGEQQVSDVVRGADLLSSTGWQIALQGALSLPTPAYAHLPLVLGPHGEKLAKSRFSVPAAPAHATAHLTVVLRLLNHPPPAELLHGKPAELLSWAARNWNIGAFAGLRSVTARDTAIAK
jgi:glutamyl-Q tRNA(Asp) synthetase